VVRRDGTPRLVLEVAMLGQGAAMEIDADLLEPAGPEPRADRRSDVRSGLPRLPAGSLVCSA
jgi:hypothetical protein